MLFNIKRLADAENYYFNLGYELTDVPWIVGQKAYDMTKPKQGARDFRTLGGNLVASGEQSFLELMMNGVKINKAQCITPCFRDEIYDPLHHPYFIKLELINTDVSQNNLNTMINDATDFFEQYTEVVLINTDIGIDIVSMEHHIELGSYGIREINGFSWVYGTGLAEPRLQQVLEGVK